MTTMTTRLGDVLPDQPLLAALLAGERFWPSEPRTLHETGLSDTFLDALACKFLLLNGNNSGRSISNGLCLPFAIVEGVLGRLRTQRLVTHRDAGPLNDYVYALTEEGQRRAAAYQQECGYVGPAPVPLVDYVTSVEAQAILETPIRRSDLQDAFHDVSVPPELLDVLGPAVNSGAGLFLYGAPGNGKSTLAHRITSCFGQEIWLPAALIVGQEVVKLYDPAYHHPVAPGSGAAGRGPYDRRWLRVRRPTVVVGGELEMKNLEVTYDRATSVNEASLQMKSNCGCLLIDDFGRQRISPAELLNRWIIPLECRHDFVTLRSGKKIQVPFEQLIIFSTNLDPGELVDEAFLRRIPYRIEVGDPTEQEFFNLFELAAQKAGCRYQADTVAYLLDKYYRPQSRALRRCHARDLLLQIRHYCTYYDLPFEMLPRYLDRVVQGFFTALRSRPARLSFDDCETQTETA